VAEFRRGVTLDYPRGVTVETSRRGYLTFDKASSSFRRNSDVHLLRKRGASIRRIKYSMMSTA
jgi:hypothetical protein